MTPFIGLHYARLRRNGFAKTGAGSANLVVDSKTQESLQGRLGIRAAQHSETESGRTLDWDVSVAWARELKDTASTLTAGLDGASSTTFNIDGPELERNRVQLGIGLTTTLRIGYDGELASSHQSHTANATLKSIGRITAPSRLSRQKTGGRIHLECSSTRPQSIQLPRFPYESTLFHGLFGLAPYFGQQAIWQPFLLLLTP